MQISQAIHVGLKIWFLEIQNYHFGDIWHTPFSTSVVGYISYDIPMKSP